MNKIKNFIFILTVFLFFGCGISYAGINVTPSIANIYNKPGFVFEGHYDVKNTYDTDIYVVVRAEKGRCFSGNTDLDINKILMFEKGKYFIPAGGTISVPYKICIGENFKGSVVVKAEFEVEREEQQTITIVVSVPIYLIALGTEKIDFDIDSINFIDIDDSRDPQKGIYYKLVLRNDGNVHIRHSGRIDIFYKNKKNLVKTINIPETVPTYCESKRDFVEPLIQRNELKEGKYIAVFKITSLGVEIEKKVKFTVDKNGYLIKENKKQK